MSSFAQIVAPWALALPLAGLGTVPGALDPPAGHVSPAPAHLGEAPVADSAGASPSAPGFSSLDALLESLRLEQVRVRQRIIIRIAPRRPGSRQEMIAQPPQSAKAVRYEEGKSNRCIAVDSISNVQTGSGNRLLLFMRDSEIMSVNLEKACRARDFYSGFYVEQSKDGKLCVDRDTLQSRNGARCEIERMAQLVAIED